MIAPPGTGDDDDDAHRPGAGWCFAILPLREEFHPVFDRAIRPAVVEAGHQLGLHLRAIKGNDFESPRLVTRDIVEGLSQSRCTIADLTLPNPNVFYELGVAHSLGGPTVMISQDVDAVPFDLRAYRVIYYSGTSDSSLADLSKHLTAAIVARLRPPARQATEPTTIQSSTPLLAILRT